MTPRTAAYEQPTFVGPLHVDPDKPLNRGDVVGRYVVVAQIGRGGMGVVYSAYDPELDRKVAIKILLGSAGETSTVADARTRLVREAQALAQLSHPGVVAIHDVGTYGDRVWLAMEFIDGLTLGAWLKQRQRPWREVLAIFSRAGEGLAAAHAAGLVHRDFKPDNVMVGHDGRVRVMDFGLARAEPKHQRAPLDLRASQSALRSSVTQDGMVMGTPQYMAPEQWLGDATDARTDQFSFCVALWEALYGQRPFGDATGELALRVTEGRRNEAPPSAVPSWLRNALERGLCISPNARWPDMPALLATLAGGARRRRRNLGLAGLAVLLATASAVVTQQRWQHRDRVAACAAEGAKIRDVWNPTVRGELRDALLAVGVPYAAGTFARLVPTLDAHADAWEQARTAACSNFMVERTWDADTAERAGACFTDVRWSLESYLQVLAAPDPAMIQGALTAAARLPAVAPCLDPRWLSNNPRLPDGAATRSEAAAIRRDLVRARSLNVAGRFREGDGLARHLISRADALGWRPLAAQARMTAADFADNVGEATRAEGLAGDALALAAEAGEDGLLVDTAILLTGLVGDSLARFDDGLRWSRLADGLLRRNPDPNREARLFAAIAGVHEARGDFASAAPYVEQSLAIWQRILGPEHPGVTGSLNNLAIVRHNLGHHREAEQLLERSLAASEQTLGPDHPTVAALLNNLGNVYNVDGNPDAAIPLFERAIAIREAALGRDHPLLTGPLINLAGVQMQRDTAAAEALATRALALIEKNLGPDHPDAADPLEILAILHRNRGDLDAALDEHTRVLQLRQPYGADNHTVIGATVHLGEVHLLRGDLERATAEFRRVLASLDRAPNPLAEPVRIDALVGLAEVALARDQPIDASRLLEQALALPEEPATVASRARAKFGLARALAASDPARARILAREAVPDISKHRRAALDAWLAAHP